MTKEQKAPRSNPKSKNGRYVSSSNPVNCGIVFIITIGSIVFLSAAIGYVIFGLISV